MVLIGVDIGGTFTDFVLLDSGTRTLRTGKLLTDPAAPDRVVLEGISSLLSVNGIAASDVDYVVHGTTLVTNALIERKGAPTWLITTQGFRDILEIGREKRYDLYDLKLRVPQPLVPRHRRLEIAERTDPSGRVVAPPDKAALLQVLESIRPTEGCSIAVVLMHAYRNAANEHLLESWIREVLGPDANVSLSSEVAPEIREYERTSTTAINAYVKPLVSGYLERLEAALARLGIAAAPMIMLSHGGLSRFRYAKKFPVRILESGPAGGTAIAAHLARDLGLGRALAFDMGGTTAKICLIDDFLPRIVAEGEVARLDRFKTGSGLPVMVPMVDLIEIGAGGGSIASINDMDLLAVGPRSAGASPGPACYGLGGDQPTVSDANLVLGYLDPDDFLGGAMRLHGDRAEQAFAPLVAALGKPVEDVAWAVYATVNQNMVRAAQMHAFDCARDLSEYTMVCSGGAAPAHACRVAHELGIHKVVIPVAAGVASALGFLVAPASIDLRRTSMTALAKLDIEGLARSFAELVAEGLSALADVGVTAGNATVTYGFEARFIGQSHALVMDIADEPRSLDRVQLAGAFKARYRETYGEQPSRSDIEMTAFQVRVQGPPPVCGAASRHEAAAARVPPRRVRTFHPEAGGLTDTPSYARDSVLPGETVAGPAILRDRETTIVVPPGAQAGIDAAGNVIIDIAGMRAP
ncbi:MAG: hydantoinase/oxoprolinase family protein [Burkholderiales bacterium]